MASDQQGHHTHGRTSSSSCHNDDDQHRQPPAAATAAVTTTSSRPQSSSPRSRNRNTYSFAGGSPPRGVVVNLQGQTLIPPNTTFARAVVMGGQVSSNQEHPAAGRQPPPVTSTTSRPADSKRSNLTVLLDQQEAQAPEGNPILPAAATSAGSSPSSHEADSASGPPLGHSAPDTFQRVVLPPPGVVDVHQHLEHPRNQPPHHNSTGHGLMNVAASTSVASRALSAGDDKVRRCMSSKELGTLAPPSGSPYSYMLRKKEELEVTMRQRLISLRDSEPDKLQHAARHSDNEGSSTASSQTQRELANEMRNRRRAQHAKAVVDDLCEVVADLFIAESKLLDPRSYGVAAAPESSSDGGAPIEGPATKAVEREQMMETTHNFVSSLPVRYALGADTPSEVLLHMRLMAAVRSDKTKVAVHIHNLEDDSNWSLTVAAASAKNNHSLRLVTISCHDTIGLLEYITKLLATGGSRVLDADVMLSTDGIVLDRFVVEMTGRLRLDKLSNLIEAFLKGAAARGDSSGEKGSSASLSSSGIRTPGSVPPIAEVGGPLYYTASETQKTMSPQQMQKEEMESAVPLSEVLASRSQASFLMAPTFPKLRRLHSLPTSLGDPQNEMALPSVQLSIRRETAEVPDPNAAGLQATSAPTESQPDTRTMRERRPLVDRRAVPNLDRVGEESSDDAASLDYVTVPSIDSTSGGAQVERRRVVPLIPFEEVMLIETIGTGRVSTIYRAAWQRGHGSNGTTASPVHMVALKVAMVNNVTNDTSHVDELRREADIAARLQHPNICDLVGVAADPECFCLAYEYCEGGSLLSLLSDSSRYYEYLPIALDVANGMAYLHSRNIIHRDLKPSNVLLTRDHRAKIADFGMSVSNYGQELTAETGTYRYMSPEVIRHESYSSNADVYSFGICLWQLITREVPFATMTPIQAAYAVAEGRRPEIPASTPRRLQEIILSCWDQDSQKRPSFTYIAMALADYAKMAFSPANVGALTLQIANEMLATVEGNSTVNVDFTTPVSAAATAAVAPSNYVDLDFIPNDSSHNVGLEIE